LRYQLRVPVKLFTEFFQYQDLNIIRLYRYIYLLFLNIVYILYKGYFIKFHTENEAIRANILISIEPELERTRFTTIIYNKYLKIIGLIDLKSVSIKGYKFLVIFS
jgi:hypothetical protein